MAPKAGLTSAEAERRLAADGRNELEREARPSPLRALAAQFKSPTRPSEASAAPTSSVPAARSFLDLEPLSVRQFAAALLLGLVPVTAAELSKLARRALAPRR